MAADQVDDHRVAGGQHVAVRALAQHRVRTRAAQRRVGVAGHGAARPAQHLAVVHLLVEAAEPQLALVAGLAQHPLDLELHGQPRRHRRRSSAGTASAAARTCSAARPHPLELPAGLHRPHRRAAPASSRPAGSPAGGGRSRGSAPAGSTSSSKPTAHRRPTPPAGQRGRQPPQRAAAARSARAATRAAPARACAARAARGSPRAGTTRCACWFVPDRYARSVLCTITAASRPARHELRPERARCRRSISPAGITWRTIAGRMILHNGPIYTMDPRLPRVAALAVAGDADRRRRRRARGRLRHGRARAHRPRRPLRAARVHRQPRPLPGRGRSRAPSSTCTAAAAVAEALRRGRRSRRRRRLAARARAGWRRRWPDGPPHRGRRWTRSPATGRPRCGRTTTTPCGSTRAALARRRRRRTRPACSRSGTRSRFPLPPAEPLERSQARARGHGRGQRPRRRRRARLPGPGGRGLWQRLRRRPPPDACACAMIIPARRCWRRRRRWSCAPALAATWCGSGR